MRVIEKRMDRVDRLREQIEELLDRIEEAEAKGS